MKNEDIKVGKYYIVDLRHIWHGKHIFEGNPIQVAKVIDKRNFRYRHQDRGLVQIVYQNLKQSVH